MATPITPLKLESTKDAKFRAAMKVEPFMKSKDDEILKMEVHVLKQLQKSKHVCRLIMAAKTDQYSFIVMTLLGKELSELRRRMPDRKLSAATAFRYLSALSEMHIVGFVHRDIKPDNFAINHAQKNLIMLFDFGLARQILVKDVNGKMVLREQETSMLYMLIELITAKLPWKGMSRRDSGLKKDKATDKELLDGLSSELPRLKGKLEEPFEWEKDKKDKQPIEEPTQKVYSRKWMSGLKKIRQKTRTPVAMPKTLLPQPLPMGMTQTMVDFALRIRWMMCLNEKLFCGYVVFGCPTGAQEVYCFATYF
uniref:Protein kinase domain-containing protein n=1 Tax=Ditylenchus dipsaci TaxID=166011 RepID=A0A915E4I2_9BILA